MDDKLKKAILEFVEIIKSVPEPLQARCFDLLLTDYLASRNQRPQRSTEPNADEEEKATKVGTNEPAEKSAPQADIQLSDLHVKAKKFLEKYQLSVADINEIFFKEGEELKPLFDDLKTTKLAESQLRIGLLQALKSGLRTGEFQFSGEDVRAECQTRKCYDPGNFSANFKNNSSLFDGFDSYKKTSPTIRLNEAGRKKLAEIIAELKT